MLVHMTGRVPGSFTESWLCFTGCVWVVFLGVVSGVRADCLYDDRIHEELAEVPTGEPCLNCTCSRSVLLCYLRVCPKLPNPPPPGCILLHRYRACCPELICSDFIDGGNSLEARSDPEGGLDIPSDDQSLFKNACISNGSIYGPGSAMHSSSLCKYCYCLTGKQICVKPKCLLPIDGCTPVFEETSCCPVRYNCTKSVSEETRTEFQTTTAFSTTTAVLKRDGCNVDGTYHPEGSKVIGIGHSVCDNCYCLRGLLRCEPLSCAPPLLGCAPVVKPGECCAASYNCNGTLEISPEPNYGLFPTISKEYSKLRKEVHRKSPAKKNKDGVVTVAPFYVLAETLQDPTTKFVYQRSPDTYGTTRHFSGVHFNPSSTQRPIKEPTSFPKTTSEDNFYLISSSKQKSTTDNAILNFKPFPAVHYATTNYELPNSNYNRVYSTTPRINNWFAPTNIRTSNTLVSPKSKFHADNILVSSAEPKERPEETLDSLGFENFNILSIVDSLLDGTLYRKLENESELTDNFNNSVSVFNEPNLNNTKDQSFHSTTIGIFNTNSTKDGIGLTTDNQRNDNDANISTTVTEPTTDSTENELEQTNITEEYNTTTTDDPSVPITLTSIVKSTDCIDNVEEILEKDLSQTEVTTIIPIDPAQVNNLAETRTEFITSTDLDIEDSSLENSVTEETIPVNVKSRNKEQIGVSQMSPDIEAILNKSRNKNGDDFDYDYNEPTLPPSLPNLKIIPFVAADALDSKKEVSKDPAPVFINKKIDDEPFQFNTNLFSPPVKTEGGFVPKEPPNLDTLYDNVVSVPSVTNEPSETRNDRCISNGIEIEHGMSVPSDSPCMICTCFYGNVVCQKPNCPPPRPGCKISVEQGVPLCCPNYICGEISLSSLDRPDVRQEIVTVAEGIIPSDPFRDVIRTEPAPNLQSLIGDMMSLQKIPSTTTLHRPIEDSTTEDQKISTVTTTTESDNSFGLEDVFKFIFSRDSSETSSTKSNNVYNETMQTSSDEYENKRNILPQDHTSGSVFNISSYSKGTETVSTLVDTGTKLPNISIPDITNNKPFVKFDILGSSHRKITSNLNYNNTNNVNANFEALNKITGKKKEVKIKESNLKNTINNNLNLAVGVGLLKLAGCNIYGRMYRVGRIISELSGPCLECKCTDVGVQCRPLKC